MAKSALILVGADKGGVGKTTVTRTLLDYFTVHQLPTRAFDSEAPKGTLKRFHPETSDIVDATTVADQMRIIDTLSTTDAIVTVVDVRAGLMSPTLRALRDIGFLEAVKKGQITFIVFHILGSSIASLNEIEEMAPFTSRCQIFPRQELHQQHQLLRMGPGDPCLVLQAAEGRSVINIPKLNEMAYEQVELASVPFRIFVPKQDAKGETANYSFVLRGYVRHWLSKVWAEYDRVKLLDLFDTTVETTAAPAPARVQAGSGA